MFDGFPQVMYISAMMKFNFFKSVFLISLTLLLISCGSTSSSGKNADLVKENDKTTTSKPAPEPAKETTTVEEKTTVQKDEYSRAVGNLSVSKDTFEADKAAVMELIDTLSTIMKDMDYQSWLLYVDKESKIYWSKPANLKKAQSKLPVKGLKLKDLQDYFKYVFVPARMGRTVTEIRYESDTYVKAVQITNPSDSPEEEKYTVYYYFVKTNGHWELNLPQIDN